MTADKKLPSESFAHMKDQIIEAHLSSGINWQSGIFAAARSLFLIIREALILLNKDGRILDANPPACKLLRKRLKDLQKHSLSDFLVPLEDADQVTLLFPLTANQQGQIELCLDPASGCLLDFILIANIWFGHNLLILRPLTNQDSETDALAAVEQAPISGLPGNPVVPNIQDQSHGQRVALNPCTDVILITDREGMIQWVNPVSNHLNGDLPTTAISQNLLRFVDSGPQEEMFFWHLWRTILALQGWCGEIINCRQDCAVQVGEMTITPVYNEAQEICHFVAIKQEITERRRAEMRQQKWTHQGHPDAQALVQENAALMLSEARYRHVIEVQADLICWFTPDGILTFVNEAYARFFGAESQALVGQNFLDLVPAIDRPRVAQQISELRQLSPANPVVIHEHSVTQANGQTVWQKWINHALFDAQGNLIELQATGRNITELKRAEAALRDREHLLELFFSQSIDGFFFMMLDEPIQWDDTVDKAAVLDYVFSHQRITKLNQALLDQYDFSEDEMLGATPATLFAHDIPEGRRLWQQMFDQGRLHVNTYERQADGTPVWIEGDYICIYDQAGRITGHFGIQRDVTSLKLAIANLEASEAKYRLLVENQTDLVVKLDTEGRFLFVSPSYCELFGCAAEDLLGQPFIHQMQAPDRAATQRSLAALGQPPYTCQFEQQVITPQGEEWLAWSHKAILDDDDHLYASVGVGWNITQRKQAEFALQRSEQQFRSVLETLRLIAVMLDPQGNIAFCNDFLLSLTGWQRDDVLQQNWFEQFIPAEIRDSVYQIFQNTIENGEFPPYYENEILTRSGDRRQIAWNNTVLRDAAGQVISITSIGNDITEQKQYEASIFEMTQRLSLACDSAQIGIWDWDPGQNVLLWDDRMYTLYRVDAASFDGTYEAWQALLHPDDRPSIAAQMQALLLGLQEYHIEFRVLRPDGQLRYVESHAIALRDDFGQVERVIGVNFDISDRKQSEVALSEAHEQLNALIENSPAVIAVFDEAGYYVRVNPITAALFGRSEADIVGCSFRDLLPPEQSAAFMARVQTILMTNQPLVVEDRLWLAGQERVFRSVLFQLQHDPGTPQLLCSIGTDVTPMIEAQQALQRQAEQERLSREITEKIRQSLDLNSILESAVTEIRTFLQADRVLVYRFNPDWGGDVIVEAVEPGWISVLGTTLRDPCFEGALLAKYRNGFIGQLHDINTATILDCYRELMNYYQVQATLSVPLVVEECLWGLLCIHQCQAPRQWTGEEVAFVQQISDQVEIAIQQAQLLEQTAVRAQRERLRHLITQQIRRSLNLDSILDTTVQQIRQFLNTDRVLVYRFNPDWSGDVIVESVLPGWTTVVGSTLHDPCFAGRLVEQYRHGRITQITDVQTAPIEDCHRDFLTQFQIKANLVLPLVIEKELWGLLCVHHCQEPRQWQQEDVLFVRQICDQVEIAIQQSQLLEQTAVRARREQLLNDIVKTVRESLDLQSTLQRTTKKLLDAFQVSRCLITLCTETDDYFECTAVAAQPGISKMAEHRIQLAGNPLAEQVLSQDRPLGLIDLFQDPAMEPLFPLAEQFNIVAVLAVSIRYQSQVKGMLAVHHRLSRYWTEDECILIKQVADQLAIAIQQAALYEQAQAEIAERVRLEEQLRHDAFHDALTGLPNRALFLDRLKFALQRFQRWHRQGSRQAKTATKHPPSSQVPYEQFAVLFLDLDRFKVINDSLGHTFGDQLLKLVAGRLTNCLRDVDTAARLGGDEFVILLEELTHPQFAIDVARRIHNVLEVPICLDGREVFVHASIGIAFSSVNYTEPSQVLRDADLAMYQAKQSKQDYVVFDAAMHVTALQQMHLENDLRHAIKRQEFRLHYQPIISLKTGQIVSFEALIRWQHPTRGLLYPGAFIDIAEDTGLIASIDFWVLQEALQQLHIWHTQRPEFADLTVSVNLSGKQFSQPDLISQIDYALTAANLDGKYLKLEITESVLIKNDALAIATLTQFRERHIQVCMDDFGTGYSSLSYLHRFPVDVLKIDKSFILNLLSENASSRDYEIVRAIINLALNLNLEVVAEGIENQAVLHYLQQNGCQFGQGHFFATAIDSDAATDALARQPYLPA